MVARESACLRRLSNGRRSQEVRFGRFLANERVTIERLLEGWSEQTALAATGRHVLAIQDTSEFNFATTRERQRGLGEIGKGVGRGLLVHAMLAVDAGSEHVLGLVAGRVWTRQGRVGVSRARRTLADKESGRWLATGLKAKTTLANAATVTVVADRESDIYAEWAQLPGPNFHMITRAMQDHRLDGDDKLFNIGERFKASAETRTIELVARAPNRPARKADLRVRYGKIALAHPTRTAERGLPKSVPLTLVEVIEPKPPAGIEPLHWRLLTTHDVADVAAAWRIVEWYKMRWTIEQLWRLLKQQGFRLEDSQLDTSDRLIKLAAIATKAAAITLQLVQARDGRSTEPGSIAFSSDQIAALDAMNTRVEGKTALQKNPHPNASLAWAAWIIARLGGWDGYKSSKPPGPITFRHGIEYFYAALAGWSLRNVCMP
jgi:Transposase DDE domain